MEKTERVLDIEISSPDKILFPAEKITKLDVVQYYAKVAKRMLPYVQNRLLTVIRCHNNINDEKFFKKHPTTENSFVKKIVLDGEEYFYINTANELIFQAQMGTLEFHTWGSSVQNIDRPNLMVFDLDPNDDVSLPKLREGVMNLKSVLDSLGLKSFLKTSGGKGYHVAVPFSKTANWEQFSNFSKQVSELLQAKWPKMFTTNIRKAERHGKIFVDYLRNKKGATCVAPYSLRARAGAPVSFPLKWSELETFAPHQVTLQNIDLHKPDAWQDLFAEKQVLK